MSHRTLLMLAVASPAWAGPDAPLTIDYGLTLAGTSVRGQPDTSLDLVPGPDGEAPVWDSENLLRPRDRERYPSALLRLGAEFQPRRRFLLRGLLDTGEIRPGRTLDPPEDGPVMQGLPLGEALREGLLLREAAALWAGSGASLEVGRRRSRAAGGLVWDDSTNGIAGTLDLHQTHAGPIVLEIDAGLLGPRFSDLADGSVVGVVRVGVPLSWFESLTPFVAAWFDRGGAVADLLASAAAERLIADYGPGFEQFALDQLAFTTQPAVATLAYFGIEGTLLPRDGMSLRAAGVAGAGSAHVAVQPLGTDLPASEPTRVRLRNWAVSAEVHQGVGQRWDVGAVGLALSGDVGPRIEPGTVDYLGFLAPAPVWAWSGLFFSRGVGQSFYPSRAASAGVNGHGVLGVGPTVSWRGEELGVELRALGLRAMAEAPPTIGGDGSTYGAEVDLRADWDLTEWATVGGEVAVFVPGSYFPEDDLALRMLLVADFHDAR